MRRIETSTLSNQSLTTALLCHTYTADADRLIFVRVFGDQLAGNGDYVAYLTVQRLGAGSAYRVVPITTAAVASGVTAAMLTTIGVPVKSTDVVKVYLTGLAGDTTTPDIITEIWEDELFITVGAAGAGMTAVPWNAVWDAEVQSEVADALVAYDAATGSDVPTVGAIADQVWDEALAGHLTAGTTGKALSDAGAAGDPWSTDLDAGGYAAGSAGDILLDLQGGTVYATGSTPNTDADLYIRRGDTVAVTIGDLTGLAAGWDVLWVTIKRSVTDDDSEAILQVRLNVATPTLPGLIYINGRTPTDAGCAATDAWISDVDAGADTLVLNIKPAASLLLPAMGSLYWDCQMLDGATITSLATGERTAEIGGDVTRATS